MPQFLAAESGALLPVAMVTAMSALVFAWLTGYAHLAARLSGALRSRRGARVVNGTVGTVLLALGGESRRSRGTEGAPRARRNRVGSRMLIRAPWVAVAGDVTELRRFSARERHIAFWAALWTAAVVAELLVLRPALLDRDEPVQGLEVVFACVGGSFAACGLVAWHRRPDSRSGALMTATGFAFFLPTLLGRARDTARRHGRACCSSTCGACSSSRCW